MAGGSGAVGSRWHPYGNIRTISCANNIVFMWELPHDKTIVIKNCYNNNIPVGLVKPEILHRNDLPC